MAVERRFRQPYIWRVMHTVSHMTNWWWTEPAGRTGA